MDPKAINRQQSKDTGQWFSRFMLFCILAAALFVILSKAYDDGVQKWAFGIVGSVSTVLIGTIRRH